MSRLSADQILDHLKSAIICVDENLNVCQLNVTAEEIFETSQRMLIGKKLYDLFLPAQSVSILGAIEACYKNRNPVSEYEAKLALFNGQQMTVDFAINPVLDNDSKFFMLLEINTLDRHLEIASDDYRLIQKQASFQLARGMAHEIKNPLGGIRGAAQLLEMESGSEKFREYTKVIIREVDRLQKLVSNMLGSNREMKKQSLNILEILEHIRSLILAEAYNGLEIIRDYDPSIPELVGDKDQLIQAFLNILSNAVQATEKKGKIIIRTRVARQYTIAHKNYHLVLVVDIIDDGPGVAEDMMDNIFLPMVTDKADGSGLGLPIAQQIITSHGGIIHCHNQSKGAVFSTILPLDNLESSE